MNPYVEFVLDSIVLIWLLNRGHRIPAMGPGELATVQDSYVLCLQRQGFYD